MRSEVPVAAPLIVAGDFNDWGRKADAILADGAGLGVAALLSLVMELRARRLRPHAHVDPATGVSVEGGTGSPLSRG